MLLALFLSLCSSQKFRGVRETLLGPGIAVSVTGIAGPGEPEPVGTVWFLALIQQKLCLPQSVNIFW